MINISDNYAEALITEIRDQETNSEVLKDRLYRLGEKVGQKISGDIFTQEKIIMTPMGCPYMGIS